MFILRAFLTLAIVSLTACATNQSDASLQAATTTAITSTRGFAPGPYGQVHYRITRPINATRPPLVLFHPSPYSGLYYSAFSQLMATDRVVIALDTPGYGDSDRPPKLQTITEYAQALDVALSAMGYDGDSGEPIDLMGFHTGTLLAVELAIIRPNTVNRLFLPGVPFFTGDERQAAYEKNAAATPIDPDGSHLQKQWQFASAAVGKGLSLEQAQLAFNDGVQCYPYCWWAYHSVFTYDSEKQFAKVEQPVLVVSEPVSLTEQTRKSASYFPNAKHLHLPNYRRSGFVIVPEQMANAARQFFDGT